MQAFRNTHSDFLMEKTGLAENILAHTSGTNIFPNMGFVQEHSK